MQIRQADLDQNCLLFILLRSQQRACIDSHMQSTSVASRCPTLHELLAANLEYKTHTRSSAHQLAVPCTLSAPKVCTLVLFISLALFQLDQVLSSPGEHVDEPAANTPRLGLSYNTASLPQAIVHYIVIHNVCKYVGRGKPDGQFVIAEEPASSPNSSSQHYPNGNGNTQHHMQSI